MAQRVNCKFDAEWIEITIDKEKHRWKSLYRFSTTSMPDSKAYLAGLGITSQSDIDFIINKCRIEWEKILKKCEPVNEKKPAISAFTDYLHMADQFIRVQPLFYTRQKIWWQWDFGTTCWKMVDEIDLLNNMNESVFGLKLFQSKEKQEVINSLKMRGRLNKPIEGSKYWIQLRDRIIDIREKVSFKATPDYFVTNPIPWKIGASEETPTIDRLFGEWVGTENIAILYEIMAYAMLTDYPLHRVFCLNGEGRNGKGTFLSMLTEFIGKDNVCSTDFDTLVTRPFEAAKLYKKLVCIMGEINSSIFKRTSLFKKLTGADIIGYEFKGKDGFDDYNYAKLIVATNKLPESSDKTIGFYSRWLIIDFPNRFKENPHLLEIVPEQEYNNLARKSIRILSEMLERGTFSGDGDIEERMRRYEERASPIREFFEKYYEADGEYSVPFWEVYEDYVSYLNSRNFRKISKREFGEIIRNRGFEMKREHYKKEDGNDGTFMKILGLKQIINEEK